ncbi:MAG: GNAT family N-acetyltransferase, partial [Myxococcota bacterium]
HLPMRSRAGRERAAVSAPPTPVRNASRGDLRPVSLVLARAFRNDPVHRWILRDEFDWALASDLFFAMVMRDMLRHESVFTTDAREGAAFWIPPYPQPAALRDRLAMAARWYLVLGRRSREIGEQLERIERAHPQTPHWYLAVLGTDPRHQGRGVGSALLAPILARCDADRVPAYLESSKRSNVPFYERHGFRVLGELAIAGGPVIWRMQREAHA